MERYYLWDVIFDDGRRVSVWSKPLRIGEMVTWRDGRQKKELRVVQAHRIAT